MACGEAQRTLPATQESATTGPDCSAGDEVQPGRTLPSSSVAAATAPLAATPALPPENTTTVAQPSSQTPQSTARHQTRFWAAREMGKKPHNSRSDLRS
ncbi:hypothetical protein Nepgr_033333 [Nepenthes gracilis]|uniref:Uncharacterized protein n=1 Tax=Nepenthes gracilis TaxID=150966 RepID=A0AAD3TKA8_NEPGR|nr:hypothetical protein Nepgr_033333 [Nepenthes gracilis]